MTTTAATLSMSSFGVAKVGNTDAEWEDAAAHSVTLGRFALADGAATAYHAGLWSHLLARGFLEVGTPPTTRAAVVAWVGELASRWWEQTALGDDAPYYLRHAHERGSHSTLLGVEIGTGGVYRALAVGDTCLFQVRDGRLTHTFPVARADDFGFQPDLVSTMSSDALEVRTAVGRVAPGDVLLGATDALAEWILRSHEIGDEVPLHRLCEATDSIDQLVHDARRSDSLRNDDVALVRCRILGVGDAA